MRAKSWLIAAVILIAPAVYGLQSEIQNIGDFAQAVGFDDYSAAQFNASSNAPIKIAVLDNGFQGYRGELGKALPAHTQYHAGPIAVDPSNEEIHGRYMAEIVAGLLDRVPGLQYELHLYSAFGYSNLAAAVDAVIRNKVDIVLYSQVWEYGGNGDGRGFINTLVNRATAAGVIWVNAAGNFAKTTYQGPIAVGSDDWVHLPAPNQAVRVRCEKNPSGHCPLRVILSWNDFKDDVNAGTDKDLDLVVTDDTLRIVATSGYIQMKKVPNPAPPGASLYPRELVETSVEPGEYFLRAKARSHNFDASHDRLRFTVSGEGLTLEDRSEGETLLSPADNASVITVGASDTPISSFSRRLAKPELLAASIITLGNDDQYEGSSDSAAVAAAAAAVIKALHPRANRQDVIAALSPSAGPLPRWRRRPRPETVLFRYMSCSSHRPHRADVLCLDACRRCRLI